MAERTGSTVYVAMPVYRGTAFVAEALRSVLEQTHRAIRVMISVDGNDAESAVACEPFLTDERVRMVVHERRLGWVANMNWLIDACDGNYFCYWQQDDHCATDYLEKLLAALARHPDAAAAYSDLRWFGGALDEVTLDSNVGLTQQRILSQIETLHWLPLRALVTVDALRRVGLIRGLEGTIVFSDYLWVLRLAVAGDLIRVPEVLYFKHAHEASASRNPSGDFHRTEREAWQMLGLEIFAEVAPRFEERDWPKLADVICDRLVTPSPGTWAHYDVAAVSPSEPARFAMDFYRALEARFDVRSPMSDGPASTAADDAHAERRTLMERARRGGPLTIDCSAAGWSAALLVDGWSVPEDWGTWSDGHRARLWLPSVAGQGPLQVRLIGRGYFGTSDARSRPRIIVSDGDRSSSMSAWRLAATSRRSPFRSRPDDRRGHRADDRACRTRCLPRPSASRTIERLLDARPGARRGVAKRGRELTSPASAAHVTASRAARDRRPGRDDRRSGRAARRVGRADDRGPEGEDDRDRREPSRRECPWRAAHGTSASGASVSEFVAARLPASARSRLTACQRPSAQAGGSTPTNERGEEHRAVCSLSMSPRGRAMAAEVDSVAPASGAPMAERRAAELLSRRPRRCSGSPSGTTSMTVAIWLRSNSNLVRLFFRLAGVAGIDLFVEAGAKEAGASRRAKERFKEARVVAFEANPYTYQKFAGINAKIEYLHLGISDSPGPVTFKVNHDEEGAPIPDGKGSLFDKGPLGFERKSHDVTVEGTTWTRSSPIIGSTGQRCGSTWRAPAASSCPALATC